MKIYDTITFVCPHKIIRMVGGETMRIEDELYHNLYVKEVPSNITNFDGVCDTGGGYIRTYGRNLTAFTSVFTSALLPRESRSEKRNTFSIHCTFGFDK